MAADEKILVVVGVHEGKFFPSRPGYNIILEARFLGESLLSDPVDHSSGGKIDFGIELAWEMTRKALQEHKLQRTPIKLVCVAVSQANKKKQEVGYVLLDLKSAQELIPPKSIPWQGLLRCQYAGKRPELRVSLTIEQNSSSVYSSNTANTTSTTSGGDDDDRDLGSPTLPSIPVVSGSVPTASGGISLPPMILDETNGWYLLGTPTPSHSLHTVSLTLSQPVNLDSFINKSQAPYHFRYSLLGNDITTEEFKSLKQPTDFHPERASVKINTSPNHLKYLLLSQSDIEVFLCTADSNVLCSGSVPISPLSSTNTISVNCVLSTIRLPDIHIAPCIRVTMELHQVKSSQPGGAGSRGVVTPPTDRTSNEQPSKKPAARRNLAQSLEEASGSVSSNSPSPIATPTANSRHSTSSTETTPSRPYSPTITTPTVNAPSIVKFTSPKTSPLLMSNSSKSPNKVDQTNRGRMATGSTLSSLSSGHSTNPNTTTTGGNTNTTVTTGSTLTSNISTTTAAQHFILTNGAHSSTGNSGTTVSTSVPGPSILKPTAVHPQPTAGVSSASVDPSQLPVSFSQHYTLPVPPVGVYYATPSDPTQSFNMSASIGATGSSMFQPLPPGYVPLGGNMPGNSMAPPNSGMVPPSNGMPPPGSGVPPPIFQPMVLQQQQMEYQSAMELEIWKMTQEQAFKKELRDKEQAKLKMLEEEYRKRDAHRDQLLKQKIEHYQSLEEQLEKTLSEVETQRKRMKTKELELNALQHRLNDEKRNLFIEVDQEKNRLKTDHTAKSEVEKLKAKELTQQLDRARKQIVDLETRLSQRNAEFDSLRDHIHNKSESRIQAELSVIQLEKKELEQKLDTAVKSKLHYKDQWSRAMKEVATLKQREQSIIKEQLKKQQQELEVMRHKYLQTEEQQLLQQQIADLRQQTQQLQVNALSRTQPHPSPASPRPLPPLSSSVSHPPGPAHSLHHHHTSQRTSYSHHHIPPPSATPGGASGHGGGDDPDADIARWIEERNILLQTGVYTHSDPTIQKLDSKIRDALIAKSSSNDEYTTTS